MTIGGDEEEEKLLRRMINNYSLHKYELFPFIP